MSDMLVYAARPTVRINEQEFPKVSELVMGMEMTEREGGLSSLELRISNVASDTSGSAGLAFDDDGILSLGAKLLLYCGDVIGPQEIFRGTITGLEAEFFEDRAPEIVVLAEDVFQQARMKRRTRTHDDITIKDLASDLANQLSLTPVITGLTDNIGTQVQLNESDLAFLRRLLDRHDADLQVVGEELHVSPRADVERGTLELKLDHELRRVRALADLAHQVTEVTVGGWNVGQAERITGTSTGTVTGPGSGRKGAEVLGATLGPRSEHVGHLCVTTEEEAKALADALFDRRARRFVTVEGTAEGSPALRVGTRVKLTGLGARFDNTYYVTFACHRYSLERGYETEFVAECPFLGEA